MMIITSIMLLNWNDNTMLVKILVNFFYHGHLFLFKH